MTNEGLEWDHSVRLGCFLKFSVLWCVRLAEFYYYHFLLQLWSRVGFGKQSEFWIGQIVEEIFGYWTVSLSFIDNSDFIAVSQLALICRLPEQ